MGMNVIFSFGILSTFICSLSPSLSLPSLSLCLLLVFPFSRFDFHHLNAITKAESFITKTKTHMECLFVAYNIDFRLEYRMRTCAFDTTQKFMYLCIIVGFSLSFFAFFFACFHFFCYARCFCVYRRAFCSKRHVDFILLYLAPRDFLSLFRSLCVCIGFVCVSLFCVCESVFVCSIGCRVIPFFGVLCIRT